MPTNTPNMPDGSTPTTNTPQNPMKVDQASTVVQGGLDVKGVVRAQGFLQYSDARLKTDISELADALSIVSALEGKTYRWKSNTTLPNEKGSKRVIGLIAQEVQKILPEVVTEIDGYLSVAYAEIVPVLIEALKQHLSNDAADKAEVQVQIRALDRKLRSLQNEQDKWKSNYHTMVAMRVLSTWCAHPWTGPTPGGVITSPTTTIESSPLQSLQLHKQAPKSQIFTYQQPKFITSGGYTSAQGAAYTPLATESELKRMRQCTSLRRWCSVLGFVLGACLLATGTLLLVKPGGHSGKHLEVSIVMIGFGVVCVFSVLVFYLCSKIRSPGLTPGEDFVSDTNNPV